MSPSPSRDPRLEERFLAWLAERDPTALAQAPVDLDSLAELGGLEREGAAFAGALTEAGHDDEVSERLLSLHAAWTRFRRSEREKAGGVAWVGQTPPEVPSEAVTWVEAAAPNASSEPTGPAPSLLAAGARPRRPEPPQRGLWRLSDLMVPVCLVVAVALLLVPVALQGIALRELRSLAVSELQQELSRGARPARLSNQAAHGSWLAELRKGQQRIVNENCEGGAWCRERLATLSSSERLAGELVADAGARGSLPPRDWRPSHEAYSREFARIQALMGEAGVTASDESEAQRRSAVLLAELAWLREEAAR